MRSTRWARALLQESAVAPGSVFEGAGSGAAAASPEAVESWNSRSLGPNGATIGIVCAVIVCVLVLATVVHWLYRSGHLPCCSRLLDDAAEDEPTFLRARHSFEPPPAAAEPPPVIVVMPDAEVEIAVSERHKAAGQAQLAASAEAAIGYAASVPHAPTFWVVDAQQGHEPAPDSPLSSGSGPSSLPGRCPADSQTVALLHTPAPRAGMQRRQRAAPSDSFVYTI